MAASAGTAKAATGVGAGMVTAKAGVAAKAGMTTADILGGTNTDGAVPRGGVRLLRPMAGISGAGRGLLVAARVGGIGAAPGGGAISAGGGAAVHGLGGASWSVPRSA